MLTRIKNKFKKHDNKVLLSNFFSLSVLQIAIYLFPLITFPYLVRVLGIEMFGVLAIATAVVAYFQIMTDYGFDLSATKEISIHRENRSKVIEIFNSVMIIKLFFMFLSLLLFSILIFSFDKLSQYWEVYYSSFGLLIGQVLLPIWFFQGMEHMKYITILTILSKTIFTFSIFIIVQEKSDLMWVPFLHAVGSITAGIISLYIIRTRFNIEFKWQSFATILKYLKDGWHIFVQRFYVNLYSTTNILVLGFLTNDTVVGLYSIATRVIDIFRKLFKVVSTVYYPYFAKQFVFNAKKSLHNLRRVSIAMLISSLLATVLIYFSDQFIVKLIAGDNYDERILNILRVLSVGIVLLPFFPLYTTVLVAIEQSVMLNKIARDTAVISLIFVIPIIFFFQEIGLAYLIIALQAIIIVRYIIVILNVNNLVHK